MSTVLGVHTVTVTATNSEGSDSLTFDLTVSRELMFFINNTTDTAVARDLDRNLSFNLRYRLGNWKFGRAVLGLSDGFYIIYHTSPDTARFYNLDRTQDTRQRHNFGNWKLGWRR